MDITLNSKVAEMKPDLQLPQVGTGVAVESAPPAVKQDMRVPLPPAFRQSEGAGPVKGLGDAVETVNSYLKVSTTDLKLQVNDEAGGVTVVSVLDQEDGKVIRQYPSDEMLEVAKRITQQMSEFREALVRGGSVSTQGSGIFTDAVA